jgi:hypothetical protein
MESVCTVSDTWREAGKKCRVTVDGIEDVEDEERILDWAGWASNSKMGHFFTHKCIYIAEGFTLLRLLLLKDGNFTHG